MLLFTPFGSIASQSQCHRVISEGSVHPGFTVLSFNNSSVHDVYLCVYMLKIEYIVDMYCTHVLIIMLVLSFVLIIYRVF